VSSSSDARGRTGRGAGFPSGNANFDFKLLAFSGTGIAAGLVMGGLAFEILGGAASICFVARGDSASASARALSCRDGRG
jgi:hypothetical protein